VQLVVSDDRLEMGGSDIAGMVKGLSPSIVLMTHELGAEERVKCGELGICTSNFTRLLGGL